MNVLYISYDGMTDPLGQSQVLPYLCGLSNCGYKIYLVSCEKPGHVSEISVVKKIVEDAGIEWYPVTYTKNPPVLSTLIDLRKLNKLGSHIVRDKEIDIVHCRSYIASLTGFMLKRVYGVRFIFDMRGFWADERVEGELWNLKNPLFNLVYKYFKRKEIQFLKNADAVVSLTHNARREIQSWPSFKNSNKEIDVIPCCADMDLFDAAKLNSEIVAKKKEQLGLSGAYPVVSYVGSLGTWYLGKEMFSFFKRLLIQYPEARFLIITTEPPGNVLKIAKEAAVPSDKIVIAKSNRSEMPIFIKCSDFSLFFIKPSYSKKASSPVKQGEIMSMGIPLICNTNIGDTDEIVLNTHAGIVIKELTDSGYDKAINNLKEVLNLSGSDIRKGAEKYFSLSHGIELYRRIYERLSEK